MLIMQTLSDWEAAFLLWIQTSIRCDALDPFFCTLSALGDGGLFWIVLGLILLCFSRTRKSGVFLLASLLFCFLINNVLIKNLAARARPFDAVEGLVSLVKPPADYSFPSGHTCSSFAAAGSLLHSLSSRRYKVLALSLAAAIALSRLYVGVHYPTDVLAGALIGLAGSWLVWHVGQRPYDGAARRLSKRR